jgi:hypothetical protein
MNHIRGGASDGNVNASVGGAFAIDQNFDEVGSFPGEHGGYVLSQGFMSFLRVNSHAKGNATFGAAHRQANFAGNKWISG